MAIKVRMMKAGEHDVVVHHETSIENYKRLGYEIATPKEALEAETGHEVVRTSQSPPTFVETDKPLPKPKPEEPKTAE